MVNDNSGDERYDAIVTAITKTTKLERHNGNKAHEMKMTNDASNHDEIHSAMQFNG